MIEIYEKRGQWCFRDDKGTLYKFPTEAAAKEHLGIIDPTECCECEDCDCDPCECELEDVE
jgi:hypothetical protein